MKKTTFITLLLFVHTLVFCQEKTLELPVNINGDTSYWYKWMQGVEVTQGLKNLKTSSNNIWVRISTVAQTIDIWSNDSQISTGH
jgi:hypothetical protein